MGKVIQIPAPKPYKHSELNLDDGTNPHGTTKADVGLGDVENIKVNLTAIIDPTVNDDQLLGYSLQSKWTNTVTKHEFTCVDATAGNAVWIKTTVPESGIQAFFLTAKGLFGTGGGWADNGFIGDVPVLFFDRTTQEKQITSFYALARADFSVDPVIAFLTYSVALPVVTTGDKVVWKIDARYIGEGEKATKAIDQTIQQTQTLTYLITDTRQSTVQFTLDGSLIDDQDTIHLTLSRVAGDANDNYSSDVAVGQGGMIIEVSQFNP